MTLINIDLTNSPPFGKIVRLESRQSKASCYILTICGLTDSGSTRPLPGDSVETNDVQIAKIVLPMEFASANQAEEFVREWGEKCGLEGRILFRLLFVVNELITGIVQLSRVVETKESIEIGIDSYTHHLAVNIAFPDSIPLDPTFDHSGELLNEFPGLKLQPDIFWHHVLLKWVDQATWSKSRNKTIISLTQHARLEDRANELYFLSLRPKPAPGLRLTSLPGDMIVAKSSKQETALRLSPQGAFVLKSVDGRTTVREIYYALVEKFGLIHPQTLGSLIENLIDNRLIVPDEPLGNFGEGKDSKIKRILGRVLRLRYSIPKADEFVEMLNERIGWLWSVGARYFYLFFILGSFALFSLHLTFVRTLIAEYFSGGLLLHPEIWVGFYLGMAVNTIVHEFSHAIMCKRYGGKVHEIGMMFYYAFPCAFVDTTDAWMLESKWSRVMVSLAGPLSSLVLSCLYGWVWILSIYLGHQNLSLIFGAIFLVGMLSTFVQFIPFIETDGYYILMDILEMPNLRRNSLSYLHSLLDSFFQGRPKPEIPQRERRIYLGYSLLSLASILFMFLLLFYLIKLRLTKYPGVFSWVLASLLVVLFLERLIRIGLNWYKRTYLAPLDLKMNA